MIRSLSSFLRQKGYWRIPLTKIQSGHYVCAAVLNGIPGTFIVDTGASHTCVALDKEEYFSLITANVDQQAVSASSADLHTRGSNDNTLQIGKWKQSTQELILFDMTTVNAALKQFDQSPVDGIIGADVLHAAKAVLDYRRSGLYLKR